MDAFTIAEQSWSRFIRHTQRCDHCRKAEGEWAKPEDLCEVGRILAVNWDRAEKNAAAETAKRADRARYGAPRIP